MGVPPPPFLLLLHNATEAKYHAHAAALVDALNLAVARQLSTQTRASFGAALPADEGANGTRPDGRWCRRPHHHHPRRRPFLALHRPKLALPSACTHGGARRW